MIVESVNSGSNNYKGYCLAPFLIKGGCQRPHINIKLFEKHLQIYRKSNRMYLVTQNLNHEGTISKIKSTTALTNQTVTESMNVRPAYQTSLPKPSLSVSARQRWERKQQPISVWIDLKGSQMELSGFREPLSLLNLSGVLCLLIFCIYLSFTIYLFHNYHFSLVITKMADILSNYWSDLCQFFWWQHYIRQMVNWED